MEDERAVFSGKPEEDDKLREYYSRKYCGYTVTTHTQLPENRGRVSSGYILASWLESCGRETLYRGGSGPWVP